MGEEQIKQFSQFGGYAFTQRQYDAIDALAVAMGCKRGAVEKQLIDSCCDHIDRMLVDAAKREQARLLDEMNDKEFYERK